MSDVVAQQTISYVARLIEINVETIRYYQRRGLIRKPPKPLQGYRIYPEETIERIRFIKRAQELGFTLAEIKDMLALGDGHCPKTQLLAEHRLSEIESRIRDLESMRKVLRELVTACRQHGETPGCPLVDSIAKH